MYRAFQARAEDSGLRYEAIQEAILHDIRIAALGQSFNFDQATHNMLTRWAISKAKRDLAKAYNHDDVFQSFETNFNEVHGVVRKHIDSWPNRVSRAVGVTTMDALRSVGGYFVGWFLLRLLGVLYPNLNIVKAANSVRAELLQLDPEMLRVAMEVEESLFNYSNQYLGDVLPRLQELVDGHVHRFTHIVRTGIHYKPDELLGTNERVFSIFGPHVEFGYGRVLISFKREILFHPDFDVTPCAGTSILSGNSSNTLFWLPSTHDPQDRVRIFHDAKTSGAVQGWRTMLAAQLALGSVQDTFNQKWFKFLRTSPNKNRHDLRNVTTDEIIKFMIGIDSHALLEAHLPPLVPLSMIHRVYMVQDDFKKFTAADIRAIEKNFNRPINDLISVLEQDVALFFRSLRDMTGTTDAEIEAADRRGFCFDARQSPACYPLPCRSKNIGIIEVFSFKCAISHGSSIRVCFGPLSAIGNDKALQQTRCCVVALGKAIAERCWIVSVSENGQLPRLPRVHTIPERQFDPNSRELLADVSISVDARTTQMTVVVGSFDPIIERTLTSLRSWESEHLVVGIEVTGLDIVRIENAKLR